MKLVRTTVLAICSSIAIALLFVTTVVFLAGRRNDDAAARLGRLAPQIETPDGRVRDRNKNGTIDPYEDPRAELEDRIADLVERMTLEEKAGLLFQPRIFMESSGRLVDGWGGAIVQGFGTAEAVIDRHIRHFQLSNSSDCRAMAEWSNRLQRMAERTRLGIPVTVATDPRHGLPDRTSAESGENGPFSGWPEPLGLAATRDPEITRRFGEIANAEYRAVGLRVALHPLADLATEPRWAHAGQTFGEDANLAAELVAAYVRGFQGDRVDSESVLCRTKHFPGAGPQAESGDPHFTDGAAQVYPGERLEYHLLPFEAAIRAGTAQMTMHAGVPIGQTAEDVGTSFNREIVTDLLRDELGFEGVVCTDAQIVTPKRIGPLPIRAPRSFGVEDLDVPTRFAKAIEAGIDQFAGEQDPADVVELVRSGAITEERIDTSVHRILRNTFRLGLFENAYVDPDDAERTCGRTDFRAAGDEAQRRSLVLLQNDEDTEGAPLLPLDRQVRIWVENVDEAVAARYGTVVPALAEADVAIVRARPPDRDLPPRSFVDRLFPSGAPQAALDFDDASRDHLNGIARAKPTVLVVHLDRATVLEGLVDHAAAIVADFGASDSAVLDLLFGRSPPEGKLPIELPASMEAAQAQKQDVPFDSEEPLFPFGFGLTYEGES